MTPYQFQRGETITLALEVAEGDPDQVSEVRAAIKPMTAGRVGTSPSQPVAAQFAVTFAAASVGVAGAEPARWLLTLTPEVSATLPAGSYLADARIVCSGGVVITEPVELRLRDAVSVS